MHSISCAVALSLLISAALSGSGPETSNNPDATAGPGADAASLRTNEVYNLLQGHESHS